MAECQETEPRLMIEPPPAFFMPAVTNCEPKKMCRRFTASRCSQYTGVTSSNLCRSSFAALFTSTDTGPSLCFDVSERRTQSFEVGHIRIEELNTIAQPRDQLFRLAVRNIEEEDPRLLAREASTITAPMPEPPPVMTTVLPASEG
jgi:hypothetical protein